MSLDSGRGGLAEAVGPGGGVIPRNAPASTWADAAMDTPTD